MDTDDMPFLKVEKQINNISYYFSSIDWKKLHILHIPMVKYLDITCNAMQ